MSSTYRQSLESWLSQLEVSANKVVDIGGSQLPVKGRTKSWDVQDYLIVDLPNPHVNSPKPDIQFNLQLDTWVGQTADMIICLEVFEYIFDPVKAMRNLSAMLKEGGTAWVSFPFFYPTHNPIEEDCLRYTEFGVKRLADTSDLKIKQIIPRRPQTNSLQAYFAAEGLRAAKGYDHAVMGWICEFRK